MPAAARPRRQPTDDWQQLRLIVASPAQASYELLRPIVLFGQPPAERAHQTGVSERTLRRKVARFEATGMRALLEPDPPPTADRRVLPLGTPNAIVELKAEYPPLSLREIAAICRARFDRAVSHHTVKQVWDAEPLPLHPPRRLPRYRDIPDPVRRRKAIVDLFAEGWSPTAIAGYLEPPRTRVYETLARWETEGWPGLEDRSRAPHRPARKVDLKTMALIRRLQANPELGEFRIHTALAQLGIDLSPRTCGRILALHRELGAPSPACAVYRALGIRKEEIERGQAWQNYIETHFTIMRRMADYHYAKAASWTEVRAVHDRFFHDYNHQPHAAHGDRPKGGRNPATVLGWVHGAWCDPADLDRLFRLRATRVLNAGGSVRFRHWRLYGERGLAGERAAVWVWDEELTIEYAGETLARYRVTYEADGHRLREVGEPRLF